MYDETEEQYNARQESKVQVIRITGTISLFPFRKNQDNAIGSGRSVDFYFFFLNLVNWINTIDASFPRKHYRYFSSTHTHTHTLFGLHAVRRKKNNRAFPSRICYSVYASSPEEIQRLKRNFVKLKKKNGAIRLIVINERLMNNSRVLKFLISLHTGNGGRRIFLFLLLKKIKRQASRQVSNPLLERKRFIS